MLEIIQAIMTKNRDFARAKPITPVGIVVHSTGAVNSYLRRYVDCPERLGENKYGNTWNRSDASTSMHAFIGRDKDKRVIVAQTLPYAYACRGCGGAEHGSFNYNPVAHLQFEICEGGASDSAYFRQAMDVATDYCARLCALFGFGVENIVSHKEAHALGYASNHDDPDAYMKKFGYSMKMFRDTVAIKLKQQEDTPAMYSTGYGQAIVNSSKAAGIGLYSSNTKTIKLVQMPKGAQVELLGPPDPKGFYFCRYDQLMGWADGQYLLMTGDELVKKEQAAPVPADALTYLQEAKKNIDEAIALLGQTD